MNPFGAADPTRLQSVQMPRFTQFVDKFICASLSKRDFNTVAMTHYCQIWFAMHSARRRAPQEILNVREN